MPTIINNPGNSTNNGNDSGVGIVLGVIIGILLVILFFIYGLPALRANDEPEPDTNINIDLPDLNTGPSGSTGSGSTN